MQQSAEQQSAEQQSRSLSATLALRSMYRSDLHMLRVEFEREKVFRVVYRAPSFRRIYDFLKIMVTRYSSFLFKKFKKLESEYWVSFKIFLNI